MRVRWDAAENSDESPGENQPVNGRFRGNPCTLSISFVLTLLSGASMILQEFDS
jgi:hypothetical protein